MTTAIATEELGLVAPGLPLRRHRSSALKRVLIDAGAAGAALVATGE